MYRVKPYDHVHLPSITEEVIRVLFERGPQVRSQMRRSYTHPLPLLGVRDGGVTIRKIAGALQYLRKQEIVKSFRKDKLCCWMLLIPHPQVDCRLLC